MDKPKITRDRVEKLMDKYLTSEQRKGAVLVVIRGYFRSMGKKSANDVGIWDDGFAWIDGEQFAAFNGNADPTRYKQDVATLKAGVWSYRPGDHGSKAYGPYPAYRQAAPVVVKRWQKDGTFKEFPLKSSINIHHGAKVGASTSSLGCLTIPYAQWPAFKALGDLMLKRNKQKTFSVLVVENDGSIA